jgi:hypothetical protein
MLINIIILINDNLTNTTTKDEKELTYTHRNTKFC